MTQSTQQTPADLVPSAPSTPSQWPLAAEQWQRVSPKFAWVDVTIHLVWVLAAAAGYLVVLALIGSSVRLFVHILVSAVLLLMLVNALLSFRRVRAIGFKLRKDDLLFRRGILFERVIAVPYGRLQLVDVTRGPLLRALGLSRLRFVTASAATGVYLPGLPLEEAEALRDRLVELAETRRSGL